MSGWMTFKWPVVGLVEGDAAASSGLAGVSFGEPSFGDDGAEGLAAGPVGDVEEGR